MFVNHSIQQEFCTYNVYNLLNIADDVRKFGYLGKFSSPFESFLSKIKNMSEMEQDLFNKLLEEYMKWKL